MSSKTKRLLTIKNIVSTHKISTQKELLQHLSKIGYNLTQATLSRDLKILKVAKKVDPIKGYVYFIPEISDQTDIISPTSNNKFVSHGFLSLKFSNNLGVIRTKSGYASSIASYIDSHAPYEILATLAGDDTILIIPIENTTPQDIKNALLLIMPDLEGKF